MQDDENDTIFVCNTEEMIFHGGRSGCGWCVKGIRGGGGDTEPWPICVVVVEILEQPQLPEMNVGILTWEADNSYHSDS